MLFLVSFIIVFGYINREKFYNLVYKFSLILHLNYKFYSNKVLKFTFKCFNVVVKQLKIGEKT